MAIAKDFRFIGRLCLDFAQTGDMGWGDRYERLTKPAELQRWLALSGLQVSGIRITKDELQRAKKVRGAIWRVAEAMVAGTVPATRDIRLINRTGCEPNLAKELAEHGKASRWHRPKFRAALATICRDAISLFGDPEERARLRRCEHPHCRVIFFDDSRPGLRRWCAANRCGDRARASAYRKRKRS